ncbi:MAG: class I SAM-dependent methyltransferase [Chloroflexi bacterium]|nr:class I SAM-dependent methyltransferase [Chloroflexota bacterium]
MTLYVFSTQDFYTVNARFHERLLEGTDPAWREAERQKAEEDWHHGRAEERVRFRALFGAGNGRAALDASCGEGQQAIPLAQLGWRVIATDFTGIHLEHARERATPSCVALAIQQCDMRELDQHFHEAFELVITCMALDNIADDSDIRRALAGTFGALRPGGRCYIRLRDLEHVVDHRLRYEWKGERPLPYGRLITIEDW